MSINTRTVSRVLLVLLAYLTTATHADSGITSTLPDCQGPGCEIIAEERPWPNPLQAGIPFQLGAYRITIPPEPRHMQFQPAIGLAAISYEAGNLTVDLQRIDEIHLGQSDAATQDTTVSATEFLDSIFTKTPHHINLHHVNNQFMWRLAMHSKGKYFEHTDEAYVYVKDGIHVYAAPVQWGEFDHLVFLTKEDRHSDFIIISSTGILWPVLEAMIGSVH